MVDSGCVPWSGVVPASERRISNVKNHRAMVSGNRLRNSQNTPTMARPVRLLDLLGQLKLTDVSERIRTATETLYQQLIEAEATVFIDAAPFERSETRTAQRSGSCFPALLKRRRHVNQELHAVVMEAYLHGSPSAWLMTWSRRSRPIP